MCIGVQLSLATSVWRVVDAILCHDALYSLLRQYITPFGQGMPPYKVWKESGVKDKYYSYFKQKFGHSMNGVKF